MKRLKQIHALILAILLCAALPALPAAATTVMEHEGLEVSIQMDKEVYGDNEPITATIVVTNTTFDTITIANLEQLIPEGYRLSDNSKVSMQDVELPPMRTLTLEVTFEKDALEQEAAAAEGDFFDKLFYGETWGIPNLLLAVLAVIAFAVFMFLT